MGTMKSYKIYFEGKLIGIIEAAKMEIFPAVFTFFDESNNQIATIVRLTEISVD